MATNRWIFRGFAARIRPLRLKVKSPASDFRISMRFWRLFSSRTVQRFGLTLKPRLVVVGAAALAIVFLLPIAQPTLAAATVPPGFSETIVPGPASGAWNGAIGII